MDSLVTNIQGYSIHDGPGIRTVVFFKGCGLECRWCSNPECISPVREVGLVRSLCTGCGKCVEVCPADALIYEAGEPVRIDRERCTGCGMCVPECPHRALVLYGESMNAEEIFGVVIPDKMFYDSSNGGVTVSGGEALLHYRLVCELFKKCREAGIYTCVETSGHVTPLAIDQVIPYTDYVLFDLKLMDSEKHRRYTGKSNKHILSNAETVSKSGVEMLFRMPLIPGINDDTENIRDTAEFLHGLGEKACRIELMPYHRLGKGKYESLDRTYTLPDIQAPGPELVETVKKKFEDFDITCLISG
jgi:pyruvate formate lyase activating enzyme